MYSQKITTMRLTNVTYCAPSEPSDGPTRTPTNEPSNFPSDGPTPAPTDDPTPAPTDGMFMFVTSSRNVFFVLVFLYVSVDRNVCKHV